MHGIGQKLSLDAAEIADDSLAVGWSYQMLADKPPELDFFRCHAV